MELAALFANIKNESTKTRRGGFHSTSWCASKASDINGLLAARNLDQKCDADDIGALADQEPLEVATVVVSRVTQIPQSALRYERLRYRPKPPKLRKKPSSK